MQNLKEQREEKIKADEAEKVEIEGRKKVLARLLADPKIQIVFAETLLRKKMLGIKREIIDDGESFVQKHNLYVDLNDAQWDASLTSILTEYEKLYMGKKMHEYFTYTSRRSSISGTKHLDQLHFTPKFINEKLKDGFDQLGLKLEHIGQREGWADGDDTFRFTLKKDSDTSETKENKEPPLQIRFLKPGLVPVEKIPEGFDSMSPNEKAVWADNYLSELDDQTIIEAMADFANPKQNGYFDEVTTEAIQDPNKFDTDEESIYSTTLWGAFSDPVPEENSLERLKTLDIAYTKALENFRKEHGTKLVENIKADNAAPQLLKELISDCKITYIGFEKVTTSLDYMPDHCVYLYLSGDILIGIQTEDKSDTWDETDYEYGDQEIVEEVHFHDVVNDNELIARQATMEEGAEAYRYLMKITDELERQDPETFRDYLLEKED